MIIFAEKLCMEPAFNNILQSEIPLVLPFFQSHTDGNFSEKVMKERVEEMFRDNYECFGIYLGKELIGMFGLWFRTRHYTGKSCEPDHIYILEQYRNRGIGKKMFSFIESYAGKKGCLYSELNSYVINYKSHKFYLNESYEIRGYHFLKKL